eukprot:scaffold2738_cov366-Prasinococcus_capsulatus_cf.AAC.10
MEGWIDGPARYGAAGRQPSSSSSSPAPRGRRWGRYVASAGRSVCAPGSVRSPSWLWASMLRAGHVVSVLGNRAQAQCCVALQRCSLGGGGSLFSTTSSDDSNAGGATHDEHSHFFRSDHFHNELPEPAKDLKRGALCQDLRARDLIHQMLRVDLAGEAGAVGMYQGQLAVLKNTAEGPTLKEMKAHEEEHLRTFNELLPRYRVRPSLLMPLWSAAGFALGFGSALLGKRAAYAATVAVEEVITEHYNDQVSGAPQALRVTGLTAHTVA